MTSAWPVVPLRRIISRLDAGVSVNATDTAITNGKQTGVLKVSCVSRGRFLPEENKEVVADDLSRVAVNPRKGDILISRANTFQLVGSSGYVDEDHANLYLSDKLWRVVLAEPTVDSSRWLIALLNSEGLRREFYRRATGTSGSMKNISQESLLAICVPRPPGHIQARLGRIFEYFEALDAQLESAIRAKRLLTQGLMQQLLSGRKRFPEFRARPWGVHRFDQLCEERSERNGNLLGSDSVMGVIKGVGFAPMRDRVRGKGDLTRYKIVPPEAFAYNPMRLNIGSIAYNDLDRPILVSPDYEVFQARPGIANPDYVNELRYSGYWSGFMNRAGAGSVRVRIYFTDLARLRIPAPEFDEQSRIAEVLRLATLQIDQLARLRRLTESYRRTLLRELLSGELQVPP